MSSANVSPLIYKNEINSKQYRMPFKVSRQAIPSINKVVLDGKNHYLGIQKDLKRNSALSDFIPNEECKMSIAWVHLGLDEILEPHIHPINSLILVTSGEVKLLGNKEDILSEGDVLAIPAGSLHGFLGLGANGFWGLSIQFEQRGLYEKNSEPLVQFVNTKVLSIHKNNLSSLLARNDDFVLQFKENNLFKILEKYKSDVDKLNMFIKYFKVWSNSFQKMVFLQYVNSHDPEVLKIADHHLQEEFGHNKQLGDDDVDDENFDPILESLANWFWGESFKVCK
jgi:quercetin dioxygenase-like cupin family protein